MRAHWLRGFIICSLCYAFIVQARKFTTPTCQLERCLVTSMSTPSGNPELTYAVDGDQLAVVRSNSAFSMRCYGNLTLDNPAFPRFDTLTSFRKVMLYDCTSKYSYSEALRRINVKPVNGLAISINGVITSEQLAGLEPNLVSLEFTNATLAPDAFKYTPGISNLYLIQIKPLFNQLPRSLSHLMLISPGTVEFQRDNFKILSKNSKFSVFGDSANVTIKVGPPLKDLILSAEFVFLDAELVETLDTIEIVNWGDVNPSAWQNCKISSLRIRNAYVQTLPNDWLKNCANLSYLTLEGAMSLTTLGNDAFRGAISLKKVTLIQTGLHQLPETLLYDAAQLQYLDLSANFLGYLYDGFFQKSMELENLNLSKNKLTSEVIGTIASIPKLKVLELTDNTRLGKNICAGFQDVQLYYLITLNLQNTSVKYICNRWRETLTSLTNLNLSWNNITHLQFADLRFSYNVTVDLTGNNITHLHYAYEDYYTLDDNRCKEGADGSQPPDASHANNIKLNSMLQCGCDESWTALALQNCPNHIRLENAKCVGGTELAQMPLESLACPETKYCPKGCLCDQIVRAEDPKSVIRVWCEHGNRTELPELLRDADVAWKLYLANNSISNPSEKDLPPNVLELDLRYNGITQVDVVTSLLAKNDMNRTSTKRILLLGGNKLDCSCGTEQQLKILVDSSAQVGDFRELKCSDGASLVVTANCSRGIIVGLILGLAPLILIVLTIIISLARPKTRRQIKIILRGLGCLPHPTEPDEGQPYDVFLSFSHLDFEVVKRIQAWFEMNGYKTIVHYRDWVPGAWIPAQIEASVRLSKRTVAVVSKNFLESTWAPVEFREAYGAAMLNGDGQPRLVVILLEDLESLNLDHPANSLLRRHLASNTYVMWNDVWFGAKLRASLPPRQHIGFWHKFCGTLFLPCGGNQVDPERDSATISMLPLPRRTEQAEAVARALAELNQEAKPEARVVVEAVMDGMQSQDHLANDLENGRTSRS